MKGPQWNREAAIIARKNGRWRKLDGLTPTKIQDPGSMALKAFEKTPEVECLNRWLKGSLAGAVAQETLLAAQFGVVGVDRHRCQLRTAVRQQR